jgi:hypothetical protein
MSQTRRLAAILAADVAHCDARARGEAVRREIIANTACSRLLSVMTAWSTWRTLSKAR